MLKIRYLIISFFILAIQACEAPLQMDSVIAESRKPTYRSDRLQKITTNGNVLVTVGSFGVIVLSTDKGVTWVRTQLETQPTFIDVVSCPDKSIAALTLEGALWISVNDGESWEEKPLSSEEVPQTLTCAPDGTLWVVGSFSTFLSSHDGGNSWESKSLDEDMILSYIKFFDTENGVVTGEFGSFFKTTDAGKNWIAQNPMPNEFYPIASLFLNMNEGWVAGLSGKILYTNNGGETWVSQESNTKAPLYGLSNDSSRIYATGALGVFLQKSFKPADSLWKVVPQNTRSYIRDALPTGDHVVITGGRGMLERVLISTSENENESENVNE